MRSIGILRVTEGTEGIDGTDGTEVSGKVMQEICREGRCCTCSSLCYYCSTSIGMVKTAANEVVQTRQQVRSMRLLKSIWGPFRLNLHKLKLQWHCGNGKAYEDSNQSSKDHFQHTECKKDC